MDSAIRLNPWPFAVVLFVGVMTFMNFSQHVRAVDAVGLSGSGFALGVGGFGFIAGLKARRKA